VHVDSISEHVPTGRWRSWRLLVDWPTDRNRTTHVADWLGYQTHQYPVPMCVIAGELPLSECPLPTYNHELIAVGDSHVFQTMPIFASCLQIWGRSHMITCERRTSGKWRFRIAFDSHRRSCIRRVNWPWAETPWATMYLGSEGSRGEVFYGLFLSVPRPVRPVILACVQLLLLLGVTEVQPTVSRDGGERVARWLNDRALC